MSLLSGIKPDEVQYDENLMRQHLSKILTTFQIEHFPQNLEGKIHKIVPLPVVLQRRGEVLRCAVIDFIIIKHKILLQKIKDTKKRSWILKRKAPIRTRSFHLYPFLKLNVIITQISIQNFIKFRLQ